MSARSSWGPAVAVVVLCAISAAPLLCARRPPDASPASRTPEARTARNRTGRPVESGLEWIEGRQGADGGWHDAATTGLALLAFTGHGETYRSGRHRDAVRRGAEFLRDGQDAAGCLAPPASPRRGLDHAIAGCAIVELYGMTEDRAWRAPAEKAVAYALRTRTPGHAWSLRAPDDAEIDVETTLWMTMLLESAAMAELEVDAAAFREISAELDRVTDPATGRLRESARSRGTLSDDAATAAGLLVRSLCGRKLPDDGAMAHAADTLVAHLPAPDTADLQYMVLGTWAMLHVRGERFRAWLPVLTAFVEMPSRLDGPDPGSSDPPGGGDEAARIRATAFHVLCGCCFYGPVGHALMSR